MGMFDSISWADPLPFSPEMVELGLNKNNWEFQTKDLDCILAHYIVQGKRIFVIKYKNERWVEGDPKAKDLMDRLGHIDHDGPYEEEVDLGTKTIRMYDYRQDVQDKWDVSVEFEVEIIRGVPQNVRLFEFEKRDNSERKARDKEFMERIQRENSLWYNRFLFHTRPWRRFAFHLGRGLSWLGNAISSLSYKIP